MILLVCHKRVGDDARENGFEVAYQLPTPMKSM